MELRTTFSIDPSKDKISYSDSVILIGSCFASSIGDQLECGKMRVMVNPFGAVFNPVSVSNTLDIILSGKEMGENDLYFFNGTYVSLNHYTEFSSDDPGMVLNKINRKSAEAYQFLKSANFLFITLGTSRVYRLKESGRIVSNCHKIPADRFEAELLTVDEIVTLWTKQLDRLNLLLPSLKVIFTISPVRHWKDGAHGNQVSKSVLFLAVEELLKHTSKPEYFPAYELVMDDLRDYRFYSDDMLHPSSAAISYIWDIFSKCYMTPQSIDLWNEVSKITKAVNHRFITNSQNKIREFAEQMLKNISAIEVKIPDLDLTPEKSYFIKLVNS